VTNSYNGGPSSVAINDRNNGANICAADPFTPANFLSDAFVPATALDYYTSVTQSPTPTPQPAAVQCPLLMAAGAIYVPRSPDFLSGGNSYYPYGQKSFRGDSWIAGVVALQFY
jgi:hypothetical protein